MRSYTDDLVWAIKEKGPTEENLLRQYGASACDLPLHARRTLDQFGTPDLATTEDRDGDQVIFRWQRDRWLINRWYPNRPVKENEKRETLANEHRSMSQTVLEWFRRNNKARGRQDYQTRMQVEKKQLEDREKDQRFKWPFFLRNDNQTDKREMHEQFEDKIRSWELEPRQEDEKDLKSDQKHFKILMVDQLWCWVLNSDNVITFFPPRDPKMEQQPNSQGDEDDAIALDLFTAIYEDVNGDNLFQRESGTRCSDCLDFVASIIWHAVKLVLETNDPQKLVPNELRVFEIFSETISNHKEGSVKAFLKFNEMQKKIAECLNSDHPTNQSMNTLIRAIRHLGNYGDLTCSINSKDVRDELQILRKLFNEQLGIVKKLIAAYKAIDEANKEKLSSVHSHDSAIKWLENAEKALQEYLKKVRDMLLFNDEVISNVSGRQNPWKLSANDE